MTTAREIAQELRKLADHYAGLGETELPKPTLQFSCWSDKEGFLAAVRALPHPLVKDYGEEGDEYSSVRVTFKGEAMDAVAYAMRKTVCKMVEPARPARFECEPLLSEQEEEELAPAHE